MEGDSLFESVDGVYLKPRDSMNPSSNGLRLGLDNIAKHRRFGYRHVTIVGRVQDCESIRAMAHASDGENEVSYITGYCHSANGAYLWVNGLRFHGGPPFFRQMGSYERADYGDLAPVPADWPHRERVEALAAEFLTALRAGDSATLGRIHFGSVGLKREDAEAQTLRFLLKDRHSPFASLRLGATPPQMAILTWRSELDHDAERQANRRKDDYDAFVCFCRTGDCAGRWPIDEIDTDNLPSRPYACTQVAAYFDPPRMVSHFQTAIGKDGLTEP
ncbi:MAG TPA: hypothetical protein VM146_13525 [Steroidobacteraceae bacterium]|nr:hypothetical protein [Steroidobacteraceae bacterium]